MLFGTVYAESWRLGEEFIKHPTHNAQTEQCVLCLQRNIREQMGALCRRTDVVDVYSLEQVCKQWRRGQRR